MQHMFPRLSSEQRNIKSYWKLSCRVDLGRCRAGLKRIWLCDAACLETADSSEIIKRNRSATNHHDLEAD